MDAAAVVRSLTSYLPNSSVLRIRSMRDAARRLARRPHEADFNAFAAYVKRSPSVVDVGANRGQAIDSFRSVLDLPIIEAFEPNPILADFLRLRYESKTITIHETALGADEQELALYLPRYGRTVWDTRASLDRDAAERALTSSDFWPFNATRLSIDEVLVPIVPLDSFRLEPDIVKIDVEGTEPAVIQGSLETIEAHRPIILVEGPGSPMVPELARLGYARHRFDMDARVFVKGESGQLNTFLMIASHYDLFELFVIGGG